jgi:chromosome segregation ATPase
VCEAAGEAMPGKWLTCGLEGKQVLNPASHRAAQADYTAVASHIARFDPPWVTAALDRIEELGIHLRDAEMDARIKKTRISGLERKLEERRRVCGELETAAVIRTEQVERLERDLRQARESNTRLHRRCQRQESALAEVAAGRKGGPSLGRALANATAETLQARVEELEAELQEERDHLGCALATAEERNTELVQEIERLRAVTKRDAARIKRALTIMANYTATAGDETSLQILDGEWEGADADFWTRNRARHGITEETP